jgi:hypothetical protein
VVHGAEVVTGPLARACAQAGFELALPPPEAGRPGDPGAFRCSTSVFAAARVSLVTCCVPQFIPGAIPRGSSSAEQLEALVLGDVAEVFGVERGEWEFADEAAGGNPAVVGRAWSAA